MDCETQYADIERQQMIGCKVLCRSNESDPLMVGTVDGWEHAKSSYIPIVKDAQGNKWFCMGIVIPYSNEMFELLSKKNPKEQYKFLCELRNGMLTFARRDVK